VEERNPDGTVVRGTALVNVSVLSIEHAGRQLEATEACRRFIGLVEDLVACAASTSRGASSAGTPHGAQ
jgi:hypothetical protein